VLQKQAWVCYLNALPLLALTLARVATQATRQHDTTRHCSRLFWQHHCTRTNGSPGPQQTLLPMPWPTLAARASMETFAHDACLTLLRFRLCFQDSSSIIAIDMDWHTVACPGNGSLARRLPPPPRCFRLLASRYSLDANDEPHAVLFPSYLYLSIYVPAPTSRPLATPAF
jgi:hypothetical protein